MTSYLIVINDSSGGYTIPSMPEIPTLLYTSYLDAKRALLDIAAKFASFTPVAYGAAYPYEHTTFEKEITQNEFALLGWVIIEEDEENAADRIPVGLLKVAHSG
jgi:hypothetical protein